VKSGFKLSLPIIISIIFAPVVFGAYSSNIMIDQFGYRTTDTKVAIFAQPAQGYNSPSTFTPGATFQVVNASNGTVVFTGNTAQWNNGTADTGQNSSSGDAGWWGDFSAFTTPGTYYINVPGGSNPGSTSYNFTISDTIYSNVLQAAVRMYLYQRCGDTITAAEGGANWNHPACHEQESSISLYDNTIGGVVTGTVRDCTGGWHDAGDYNKYVPFTNTVIWDLLHAYEWNPCAFGDNTGIPESGNGVPDILDEIKWELDWELKMQVTNTADANYGACFSVVGELSSGASAWEYPPNNDTSTKNYTDISSFATSTLAMNCADAARIFANFTTQYPGYSTKLQNAAVAAWNWLSAHTAMVSYDNTNFSQANANGDSYSDNRLRTAAAAELFRLTGNATYQAYFDANYNNPNGWDNTGTFSIINQDFWPTNSGELERAMIDYCLTSGATASIVTAIENALATGVNGLQMGETNADLYRAYMWSYYWGSNQGKATWGDQLLWAIKLNVDPANNAAYLAKAEDYLHYFHGVNPTTYVYLTNMGAKGANLGASNPIMSIYHSWFEVGTIYDGNTGASAVGPAPGYLSGGPNPSYAPDASYGGTIVPPQNQPPQKSYKDWGANWPQDSWEVTEPGLYYQAAYVFLCSQFAACTAPTATHTVSPTLTASITGTPPTYTFTPTITKTFTVTQTCTVSPTYTQTPAQCEVMNYTGEAPYNMASGGTWIDTSGTVSEVTAESHSPTHSMEINFVWTAGYYQGMGWNWANWNTANAYNASAASAISLWLMSGSGTITSLTIALVDSTNTVSNTIPVTNYLAGGVTGTWQEITIPLSLFTGVNMASLWELRIQTGGTETGNQTIYLDDFGFWVSCGTATNTPVMSPTITLTKTPTITYSATCDCFTGTFTPTYTITDTNTLTNTPTLTYTGTPTATVTDTMTATCTWTETFTPTFTNTVTRTNTCMCTLTDTLTSTYTFTSTPPSTFTQTPTFTNTGTYTCTSTATDTCTTTPTSSPTRTETLTDTGTSTNTPSLTPTSSLTSTVTLTLTDTPSPADTRTVTPTNTDTLTATPTFTITLTFTPVPTNSTLTDTPTISPTSTDSPTDTQTPTPTSSYTDTFTGTPSGTPSATQTATDTVSMTSTVTYTSTIPSATFTQTVSATNTVLSATPSGTLTLTITFTMTQTDTPQDTPTASSTINVQSSMTNTPTETASATSTATESSTANVPSSTQTMTATESATAILPGPTLTITATLTTTNIISIITLTPTPAGTGTLSIGPVKPYPNPYNPGWGFPLKIWLNITTEDVDGITIKIYTVAYRLVKEKQFDGSDAQQVAQDGIIRFESGELQELSPGTYYYVVTASKGGVKARTSIDKIIILK